MPGQVFLSATRIPTDGHALIQVSVSGFEHEIFLAECLAELCLGGSN